MLGVVSVPEGDPGWVGWALVSILVGWMVVAAVVLWRGRNKP
ncbi:MULTISPECIES: hypothetical protein [unclassified Geodermatophilus]